MTAGQVRKGLTTARICRAQPTRPPWAGPTAYRVVGAHGLYTKRYGPAITTPWLWPARPPTT